MLRNMGNKGTSGHAGDKDAAKREKLRLEKAKNIQPNKGEAGSFQVTHKIGNDKALRATNDNQIGISIVGGQQSNVGEFPYYGMF